MMDPRSVCPASLRRRQCAVRGVRRSPALTAATAHCWITVLGAILAVSEASAQTVRGTVTERESNTPLAGALVTLDREEAAARFDTPLRRTATNQNGAFVIRAPDSGRFRLTVRRIGAKAHSETIALSGVDILEVNVQLDAFTALPTVAISDSSLCITRNTDNARVARLWEAARTSLSVLIVSKDDTILGARLVRYSRQRNADDFEILTEELHSYDARDGVREPGFRSRSGPEFSASGYWRQNGLTTEFYAPDAAALLSAAFLKDHCFGVQEGNRQRPGLVGLTFAPVRGRPVAEISGTLWLDARTNELQFLELEWLGLPPSLRHERVGAQLHFLRLPTGAVIVKRWSLVMPQSTPSPQSESRSAFGNAQSLQLVEEGGIVVIYGLDRAEKPGSIVGRVVRANNAPMRWARVRLMGLPHETVVDSAGGFQFDNVPPGPHSIVVEHSGFDAFGLRVAEVEFLLDEGAKRALTFRAPSETEMFDTLCPGSPPRAASLRVLIVDDVSLQPVSGAALRVHWLERVATTTGRLAGEQMREMHRDFRSDRRGSAQFCALPPSSDLTLSLLGDNGTMRTLRTVKLNPRQNEVLTLRIPSPIR
jgi:hypothetical protein